MKTYIITRFSILDKSKKNLTVQKFNYFVKKD